MPKTLGQHIKSIRKETGQTQEELAAAADVHRTYVSLLERDEKSPTLRVFFRVCDALGCSPSSIISKVEGGQ